MVSLQKVEAEAPHLAKLAKGANDMLIKKGLDPSRFKSAFGLTVDNSGSTGDLYRKGTIQEVVDIAIAAGMLFDDDGTIPASVFNNQVEDLGEITLANSKDFLRNKGVRAGGGTDYVSALQWIIDAAGFGNVKLGGGLFGGKAQGVKATAPYPFYGAFITDGEPNPGTEDKIRELLTAMSQLPIFVQFIGVGPHRFSFLEELDDLPGRLIDNANFFDAKGVGKNTDKMLEAMFGEFPSYYAEARRAGLLV